MNKRPNHLLPLILKKPSALSLVSAVTLGLASEFGGHLGGHSAKLRSIVSACFVSGVDTRDTLTTSGGNKEGCSSNP